MSTFRTERLFFLRVSRISNNLSTVETLPEPIKKVIEEKFTVRKLSQDEETIKNRVRLLKKENDKMLRKITEANSRAKRIFEAKMRNE